MSAAERELVRLMRCSAQSAGLALSVNVVRQRDWASSLFVGDRYTIDLTANDDGDAFDQWLADLPDKEFPLRGQFVADAEVTARSELAATVEILLIEES